ncbi:MAG: hypothetical protein JXB50_11165 [Spirochaetes bacterium]|nr:hypothetical protein [Spirochaetota bacterium]
MKIQNINKKSIIIGAGLGGLITGILLKKAKPDDEVIIYDSNKLPGGFCNAFQKAATYRGEKIKYTFNVPVVASDFGEGEPLELFFKYMGVKNINWKIVEKPFQYYPIGDKPFIFTKNGVEDIINRTPDKEKKSAKKFFENMQRLYRDVFHRAYINPNFLEALKMLFTIPKTTLEMIQNKTYLQHIKDMGIKTTLIKELFSITEGYMGVEVEKASAIGELLMIQSFLENNLMRPTKGDTFQTLSNNLAKRYEELGGKLVLNTKVDSVAFDNKKALGVMINNKLEKSDYIFMSVAQDRIKELITSGIHIPKIKRLINKINKIPYPNSDFYCLFLMDKKAVEKYPKLTEFIYHIYRMEGGLKQGRWNLFMFMPEEMYNYKYYAMTLLYIEHDREKIDEWFKLRETDYKKYEQKKEEFSNILVKELQKVEPVFKEFPPLKYLIAMSPASYIQYGSKYPISGLAQVPENSPAVRMKQVLLDNLFISGGASFSAGVWGATAGGWLGFVEAYKKMYGVQIGNKSVLYKPDLKNLP